MIDINICSELKDQHEQLEEQRSNLKKRVRDRYGKAVNAIQKRNQQAVSTYKPCCIEKETNFL